MIITFFKCLFFSMLLVNSEKPVLHPFYVTVTEIEHNVKNQTLEISSKIFTDDFEHTLRKHYSGKIDLLNPADKEYTSSIVSDYIKQHLKIKTNGNAADLIFVGYEEIEEGIISYFECKNIKSVKTIEITDNLLYDYKPDQISIIHVTVNGKRQSNKIVNPEERTFFEF